MPRRSPRASTEITAADRKARAVELRARGYSFQQIADTLGYSSPSGASKAYHSALRERPAQNVDELRAEAAGRYEYLLHEAMTQVADPGPTYSAIGRLVCYDDTHPLAGQPVPNQSVKTRAIESARKLISDYMQLNAVTPGRAPAVVIDQRSTQMIIFEINADRALRGHPPLPAIPGITT